MPMVEWYVLLPPVVAVVVVVGIVWFFRLYFMAFDMMDWLHWISFGVGIGQVVFILYYYIPLMQWHVSGEHTTGTEHKDKFISDLLFSDSVYRSVMTFFVALQLGVCAVFVTRLRIKLLEGSVMFGVEMLLFVCAWVGWTVLCAKYTNQDGMEGMSVVHASGVGVFVVCSLAYVIMLSYNVSTLFSRDQYTYCVVSESVLFVMALVVSMCLGLHFIICALLQRSDAWVTEHLALIFFVLCHILLFFIDSSHTKAALISSNQATAEQAPLVETGRALDSSGYRVDGAFFINKNDTSAGVFHGVRIQL